MKAIVFHGVGDIRLDDVPEPKLKSSTDAILRITSSAICGTDLHMIRGTLGGMKAGTILGHEAVGVIEEAGKDVKNLRPGQRVVIPSTIACGNCVYCRAGYFAQCDEANPNGPQAGTAFFGGPKSSGPFDGLQAEFARIPFAHVGPMALPDEIFDDQAICLSDIFPTGYFGAKLAKIRDGNTVAVFGCGPVGQFAIISAKLMGASRVFAVDCIPSRLAMARNQQAEVIDFNKEDPAEVIQDLTEGIGVDRAIDAVGVDAMMAKSGPAAPSSEEKEEFAEEQRKIVAKSNPHGNVWIPGDAPSQALRWAVEALAKAGTLAIIGVYAEKSNFPIGMAMEKNLSVQMGNCNHRKYLPALIELVRKGTVDPLKVLTHHEPLMGALEAYAAFDTRQPGWIKVELKPERH
ncbi:MAG TPA: zinc-dependent alcohol dehydrogenase [Planctomycetota bacterium]|nr:zinc-dependent alcohol dehydrogenase [Planctomycetota bacterium]